MASGDSRESAGGCILAWGTARLMLKSSTIKANIAKDADGGAIALLQDSTLEISGSSFEGNQAYSRGGAVFVGPGYETSTDAIAVTLFDENLFISNSVRSGDGGAVFTYRIISFAAGGLSTIVHTRFVSNSAPQGSGGGLSLYKIKLQVENRHSIECDMNQARFGGGIALLSGASLVLIKELCPLACDQSRSIGDGTCHPECFNRACRFVNHYL